MFNKITLYTDTYLSLLWNQRLNLLFNSQKQAQPLINYKTFWLYTAISARQWHFKQFKYKLIT